MISTFRRDEQRTVGLQKKGHLTQARAGEVGKATGRREPSDPGFCIYQWEARKMGTWA